MEFAPNANRWWVYSYQINHCLIIVALHILDFGFNAIGYISYYVYFPVIVMCLIVDIYETVWLTVRELSHIRPIVFLIICVKLIIWVIFVWL